MDFYQQPPSKQWGILKFRGTPFAEVWFKPDENPTALVLRIPQESYRNLELSRLLTMRNLLRALTITPEAVTSWVSQNLEESISGSVGTDLDNPLPCPPVTIPHLLITIQMKEEVPGEERSNPASSENSLARWQELQKRWNSIQMLEAKIDSLRQSVESGRIELDTQAKRNLTPEEKVHALSSDISQWTKAKSRAHHALPRARDFVQRATWAMVTPERKALDEILDEQKQPFLDGIQLEELALQVENLMKDRQTLAAQGVTVSQECKNMSNEIRTALTTLQNNAATRARQKKNSTRGK